LPSSSLDGFGFFIGPYGKSTHKICLMRRTMATVYVPTPLRRLTGGQSKVDVQGANVGALIQAVEQQYPGVAERVLDENGNVKRFINVFVNDDEIGTLQGLDTPVSESDRVSIVPAMAGGNEVSRG
jgi:molybdopterin synthase sulfur carrier subunit